MNLQSYIKVTTAFLSIFISSMLGFLFISTHKQDAYAASEIEYKNKSKSIELTITNIKSIPASETMAESIEVTSTLSNNSSLPISYQSGCGVAPILYARKQHTGKTYKLLVRDINADTTSSSCLTQDIIIAPQSVQTQLFIYQLNGLDVETGEISFIDGDSYKIEQGMSYIIHTINEKNRYKKLEDREIIDNFPLKRIRSNEVVYSASNTQTKTNTTTPTNTPALTPTPTSVATAWLNPSANSVDTGGDGNGYGSNPSNAYTNNSSYAVDTNSGNGSSTSCTGTDKDRHRYYNYNIAIPTGSTATGIEAQLVAKVDSTSGSPKICVQLSWDGGASWTTAQLTPGLSTSKKTYTVGGPTNIWGRSWNSSDFSNTNFRLRVINIASNTSRDFSLDWAAVKVYYNAIAPTITPTQTPSVTPLPPTPTFVPTKTLTPTPSIPYPQNSLVGPFNPKVLIIDYNTTGTTDDGSEALTSQLIQGLKTASRYHNNSVSSANFSVYRRFVENNPPPLVSTTRADYQAIFTKYNVCEIAQTQGVKFVWIWVHENYADKFLEWVTTGPTFYQTYSTNVPTCSGNTVVTFGLNYNTSVANGLHSFGHYMENVGYYAFGPVDFDNISATDMWDLFDGQAPRYRSYTGPVNTTTARCGNVHFLPNTTQVYDYGNNTTVLSDCATYNPGNPSVQQYIPINQSTWMQQAPCDASIQNNLGACQTYSYLAWWMQNMPGYNNLATDLNHDPMPDWWQYFLSLDSTIRFN